VQDGLDDSDDNDLIEHSSETISISISILTLFVFVEHSRI